LDEEERSEKAGLYPLQALVQPVSLRFKYHFDGTRETNRLDKVMSSQHSTSRDYQFLFLIARVVFYTCTECRARASIFYGKCHPKSNILLRVSWCKCLGLFSAGFPLAGADSVFQAEFTRLLLPLLSRKINRTIPTLLPHPSLLAHTIYQALAFDAVLIAEGFTISKTFAGKRRKFDETKREDGANEWNGISELILGTNEWFEIWMEGEKKCQFELVLCSF